MGASRAVPWGQVGELDTALVMDWDTWTNGSLQLLAIRESLLGQLQQRGGGEGDREVQNQLNKC